MKIAGNEVLNIDNTLQSALRYGARYVCLDTGSYTKTFRADTMHFFDSKTAAQQYAFMKRANANEYLTTLPVMALQQQLSRRIELQQLTGLSKEGLKDIVIDIPHIFKMERARQEIYIKEIFDQLYDRGINPDMARLVHCIANDDLKFVINGRNREYGEEKRCTIYIEQNSDRAFLITSIEQQISYQQKNQERMKSEALEGTVRPKDALEIKKFLQEEKEAGNRFLSFPSGKNGLKKEDFNPFRSAIDAYQHANMNSNGSEKYTVRSIPIVEKEVDRVLDNKKEQKQENAIPEERRNKRSRDRERFE